MPNDVTPTKTSYTHVRKDMLAQRYSVSHNKESTLAPDQIQN
jgi:hypothetical protein